MQQGQDEELRALDSAQIQVIAYNNVFSTNRLKDRCLQYTNAIYKDTYDNRKVRKAFRNQLFGIMKQEIDYIRANIRMYQKNKKARRLRAKTRRSVTAYSEFCRYMRETRPHHEIAGKLQKLWKESRGLAAKERKREKYSEEKKESEEEEEIEGKGEPTVFANVVYEEDSSSEEEKEN